MATAPGKSGIRPASQRLSVPLGRPMRRASSFCVHPLRLSSLITWRAAREGFARRPPVAPAMADLILPYGSAVNRKELDAENDSFVDEEVPASKPRKSLARARMLTPMGQRILASLEHVKMSQAELERQLWPDDKHRGRGRISRYMSGERGQRSVDPMVFDRMAEILGVDFRWLLTGKGEMFPAGSPVHSTERPRPRF